MAIKRIEAHSINGEVKPEIAIISSLGEHIRGQYVLVTITDDQGHEGLGEASVTSVWSGETQTGTLAIIREVLAPPLIGADPFDLEWTRTQMERAVFGNSFAKAAIEMALLDLQGKILNVPIYRLLGGKRKDEDGIRLKFVVGAVEPATAAQRAAQMVEQGWRAIKVKVGKSRDVQADIERVRAVRQAVGEDVWLSVDANGGYCVHEALAAARGFERYGVALFEQPTPRRDFEAMAEVRSRSGIPVMADEAVFTMQDALEIIRHRAADVVSLYPGKHGGMRATQEIARVAQAAGLPCTIGSNLEREVATAAMAHVTVATANLQCDRYPGDLIGPLYYRQCLTETPLEYCADRLKVPEGPGLGVNIK